MSTRDLPKNEAPPPDCRAKAPAPLFGDRQPPDDAAPTKATGLFGFHRAGGSASRGE